MTMLPRSARPTYPTGFDNRVRANWKLQFAIAELASGDWPKRAREAAKFIAGKAEGSQGARLFAAFYALCAAKFAEGATEIVIPSRDAVTWLKAFDPYWVNEYRGSDGHPAEITQNKLAPLLGLYEIQRETVHPTKRSTDTCGGYKVFAKGKWNAQWLERFAQYCPGLPDIRTLVKPEPPGRKK
jgi:Protein of unknown function (DUF3631)